MPKMGRIHRTIALGLFLLLSLCCCGCPGVDALRSHLRLDHDDRAAFHIESFGYEEGGKFRIAISDLVRRVPENSPVKDTYETAFVLQRSDSDAPARLSPRATTADSASRTSIAKVTSAHATAVSPEDIVPRTPSPAGQAAAAAASPPDPADVSLVTSRLLDSCFHLDSLEGGPDANLILKLGRSPDGGFTWSSYVFEHTITTPGYYHLYFSNCEPLSSISLEMELEQYNLYEGPEGPRMYLPAGERFLPTILVVLSCSFLLEWALWAFYLFSHREHVRSIHLLMLVALALKCLSVALESLKYHQLKIEGDHNPWFIVLYIVSILKGCMVFCVIVLLATGWSYLKPFLTDRDKQVLLVVVTVQALVNLVAVVVGELNPAEASWGSWHDLLTVLDIACWVIILFPIAWSIRSLKARAVEDQAKGERAARNMLRLQAFRSFYLLVITFVYFTRIIVFLLQQSLPFEQQWLGTLVAELASLAFFALTGILFRPQGSNPYMPLDIDAASFDDDAARAGEDEALDQQAEEDAEFEREMNRAEEEHAAEGGANAREMHAIHIKEITR